ncbi:MAG: hypothetical protein IPJ88_04185 [Myxococcales bacterium]|nr:MAG: hypothetical protein IPJ88_04185 [Myxococcales bacterium]
MHAAEATPKTKTKPTQIQEPSPKNRKKTSIPKPSPTSLLILRKTKQAACNLVSKTMTVLPFTLRQPPFYNPNIKANGKAILKFLCA